jgi:LacI family transcriptional regulator
MIEGPPHFRSAQERKAGFLAALPDRCRSNYLREGDYGFESGLAAAASLLALDSRRPRSSPATTSWRRRCQGGARAGVAMPGQLSVAGSTIQRPGLDDHAGLDHHPPAADRHGPNRRPRTCWP